MITATEIKMDSIDATVLVAPNKGKEVTPEEFEKIRQEKMKEMGMQRGGPGGGQHMMIMSNNVISEKTSYDSSLASGNSPYSLSFFSFR